VEEALHEPRTTIDSLSLLDSSARRANNVDWAKGQEARGVRKSGTGWSKTNKLMKERIVKGWLE
jgi:hypothetical protein